MRTTIVLIFYIFFFPLISNAGWFSGPQNYDECVLEKMKGQDRATIPHARSACRKLFPIEKEIFRNERLKIKTAWRQNGPTIEMIIEENLSNYNISKIDASFSTKECSEIEIYTEYTLTKEFSFKDETTSKLKKIFASEDWKTKSIVEISDNQPYKCSLIKKIWGYPKK